MNLSALFPVGCASTLGHSGRGGTSPQNRRTSSGALLLGLLLLAFAWIPVGLAGPAGEIDDNIYNYLQLLRSDFNSAKVEVVNRIMKLSASDAKAFWPIYRAVRSTEHTETRE